MKPIHSALTLRTALLALLTVGAPAFAASTWNFGTINTTANPDVNPGGNKCTVKAAGTAVDVDSSPGQVYNVYAGKSYECSPTTAADGVAVATAWSTNGAGAKFAAAEVKQFGTSGFGVANTSVASTSASEGADTTTPQHSMDNNGFIDLIKLEFTKATVLDSVGIGWSSTDSDLSVYRFVGGAGSTTNIAGLTTAEILTKGWELVGDYANLATTTNNYDASASTVAPNKINAAGLSSSWWLISAYTGTSWTNTNDYMKLLAVASIDKNETPEPSSLALMGMALAGVVAARRRRGASRT